MKDGHETGTSGRDPFRTGMKVAEGSQLPIHNDPSTV